MFYLRIKLICVWFEYVVRFISITCFSCHQPYPSGRHPPTGHLHLSIPKSSSQRSSLLRLTCKITTRVCMCVMRAWVSVFLYIYWASRLRVSRGRTNGTREALSVRSGYTCSVRYHLDSSNSSTSSHEDAFSSSLGR